MRPLRQFGNPKPSRQGRIGHPGQETNKLFLCAGVIFTELYNGDRWCLRLYPAQGDYPAVTVWTRAERVQKGPASTYLPQRVWQEADLPSALRDYGYAELVRLRLKGRFTAA